MWKGGNASAALSHCLKDRQKEPLRRAAFSKKAGVTRPRETLLRMMMLGKRAEKPFDALATKTGKPGGWEFTFRWPPAARLEPLTLFLKAADLKARDPEGKSLLTGKLRHLGLLELERASESIEFLPLGPKEG